MQRYWTKEKLKEYLAECVKNGESLSSHKAPNGLVTAAVRHYGSWAKFLDHGLYGSYDCEIEEPKKKKRSYCAKAEIKKINIENGIDITDYINHDISERLRNYKTFSSLCWNCFRPLSAKIYFCPWHDHLELPKGAVFLKVQKVLHKGPTDMVIIKECPLFIKETKELRRESQKELLERWKKQF